MPRTRYIDPNPFYTRIRGAIDDVVVKVARQDPSCCAIHCTIEHINQANRSESNESGEQLETERTTPSKTTQHGIAYKASTTASFFPTCCSSITPDRSKDHRMVVVTALATPHPEPMSPPRNWRLHSRASRVQWLVKELQVVDRYSPHVVGHIRTGRDNGIRCCSSGAVFGPVHLEAI